MTMGLGHVARRFSLRDQDFVFTLAQIKAAK